MTQAAEPQEVLPQLAGLAGNSLRDLLRIPPVS